MADPVDDPKEGEPKVAEPNTDVQDLLVGFKDMVNEVKEAAAARPAPAPVVDDSEERKATAQAEYNTAREKVNEQLAAGEGADAMETYMQSVIKLQTANSPDPSNSPQVKASIASAKKLSRGDNREMFDKYAKEIEADMAAMPIDERINPEAWDSACRRVKADKIDDIIASREAQNAEDIKKAEDDARANAVAPPMATRGRGTHVPTEGVNADNLNDEQLRAADSCGLTPEVYAKSIENYDKHIQRGGSVLFMNETTKGLKIEPGSF